MKKLVLAGAVFAALTFEGAAVAQEARLRLASFLPGNQSFGIPAKRWVDEVNKRGKGIVQITLVGPDAVPLPEQPNAVKTGVIDMHSGPPTFYRGTLIEGETMTLSEKSVAELKKNGAWDFMNRLHAEKMNVLLLTGFGDGVNFNAGAPGTNITANGIYTVFPYLPTPHDGRNRRHVDCAEPLANPCQ